MLDRSEASARERVRMLDEQRLVLRITTSEGKESNDGCIEIDLSSHEPVSPKRIDQERVAEH
jgi:hypothetical protein